MLRFARNVIPNAIVLSQCQDRKGPDLQEDCFDINRSSLVGASVSPIVIYLDSVVVFNEHVLSLGRIELDNYGARTANFIP